MISIITPTFNAEETLLDCLNSVKQQSHKDIEQVIIDGRSIDQTLDIIKKFDGHRIKLFSERDDGIYDAVNKGIINSSGDIISWLNSDDKFASSDVLSRVIKEFADPQISVVFGDLNYVDRADTEIIKRQWKSGPYNSSSIQWGWMPPTPAVFFRKADIDLRSLYDVGYKISGDYEFFLRNYIKFQNSVYIPDVLILMRLGGVSNAGTVNTLRKWREDYRAIRSTNSGGVVTLLAKSLRKIGQIKL